MKLLGHEASPEIQARAAGDIPVAPQDELRSERHRQALASFAQARGCVLGGALVKGCSGRKAELWAGG